MSPKSNYLNYLCYFHKLIEDFTPAKPDDPEWATEQYIDNHRPHPDRLKPLTQGKAYVLKMEAEGLRLCHYCGHYRPLHMFGQFNSKVTSFNPKGYDSYCKGCRNTMAKKRKQEG